MMNIETLTVLLWFEMRKLSMLLLPYFHDLVHFNKLCKFQLFVFSINFTQKLNIPNFFF